MKSANEKIKKIIFNECHLKGYCCEAAKLGFNYAVNRYNYTKDFSIAINEGLTVAECQHLRIKNKQFQSPISPLSNPMALNVSLSRALL